MGKGRDKQLVTKRMQRCSRQVTKKKGLSRVTGHINDANRIRPKGMTHLRDRATIKRLKMYTDRPVRTRKGRIIKEKYMSRTTEKPVSRIAPDRRWFGNTKVISSKQLELFRENMEKAIKDPYTVVLKHKKLPYGLLSESKEATGGGRIARMNLLKIESFQDTFDGKVGFSKRKKPKLKGFDSYDSLRKRVDAMEYDVDNDRDSSSQRTLARSKFEVKQSARHLSMAQGSTGLNLDVVFNAGESQRVKSELFKVVDSSDVLLQVLDARDPMGTRSPHIEKYIKTQCAHKHVILVLNKIDLVPTWVSQRWLKILSLEFPTVAFHASLSNAFGKGALISLMRQMRALHEGRRTLSVGLIGYPNVGKSSVLNALVGKKATAVAPIPGQTKVWQYVSLFDKFYLIDCPGVVYPRPGDDYITKVLRSVVRIESLSDPYSYVPYVLERVRKEYICRHFDVDEADIVCDDKDADGNDEKDLVSASSERKIDCEKFMKALALRRGKLLKGGEPDYHNLSCQVLYDWQRGRLPWFVCPPFEDDIELAAKIVDAERELADATAAAMDTDAAAMQMRPIDTEHNAAQMAARKHLEEAASKAEAAAIENESDKFKVKHDFFMDDVSIDTKRFLDAGDSDSDSDSDEDESGDCLGSALRGDSEMKSSRKRKRLVPKKGIDFAKIMPKSEKEMAEVRAIKVANPLKLAADDPLLFQAKLKKWWLAKMKR